MGQELKNCSLITWAMTRVMALVALVLGPPMPRVKVFMLEHIGVSKFEMLVKFVTWCSFSSPTGNVCYPWLGGHQKIGCVVST
jgi:hypothetical protein